LDKVIYIDVLKSFIRSYILWIPRTPLSRNLNWYVTDFIIIINYCVFLSKRLCLIIQHIVCNLLRFIKNIFGKYLFGIPNEILSKIRLAN